MKKSNVVAVMILVSAIGIGTAVAADSLPATNAPTATPPHQGVLGKDADGFRAQQKAAWQAHHQQQEAANKAFRATLKDKTPAERQPLIQQHHAQQEAANKAFEDQMHAKTIAHINASNLTDAQKAEAIKKIQAQWAKQDAKRAEKLAERKAAHAGKGGQGNGQGIPPNATPTPPTLPSGN